MSATRIVVLVLGLLLSSLASANVEKVIFLGPEPVPEPQLSFNGPQLRLETLSPQKTSLQQTLLARFPATTDPRTLSETWILLDNLRKDQRYEQPTAFELSIHDPAILFETATLNNSFYAYSNKQAIPKDSLPDLSDTHDIASLKAPSPRSSLFLHVSASADYFSTNTTLMRNGLMVDVEIILDPFLLDLFPKSLVPTAVYLLALALVSWVLSSFIWQWLSFIAQQSTISTDQGTIELQKKHL
ncbi:hypothetical protein MMC19_001893 [Ptychographa xylographoides]|nr:hypothetical protein [Ptychographa xylographoides]